MLVLQENREPVLKVCELFCISALCKPVGTV